jgi:Flp pilus assembly protein TadD
MKEFRKMIKPAAMFMVCAAGCTSCVRTVRTSTQILPDPVSRTAVSTVMKRHVENATDRGDGDLELRELRQRLAAHPDDLQVRLQLASLYLQRGVPDLALEHYRLANAQYPNSVEVAVTLAKALRGMGAPEEALKTIGVCSVLHPEGNWELLSFEGILRDEQGQLPLAEAAYRKALALEPGRGLLHNNLGYNLLLQKKPEEAAVEFRRSLELDPRSVTARNNLAEALAASPKESCLQCAHDALSELQRAASSDAVAHNNMAAVLLEQGRYAEARIELNAALEARPNFDEALQNLRLASEHDGQPVTIPAPKSPVNFWSRVASEWGRLMGSGHDAKAASGAQDATRDTTQPAVAAPAQRKNGDSGGSN